MTHTITPDIHGLIFDFDGTLVDSMPVHFHSWTEAFSAHGCEFTEKFFYDNAGVSLLGVVRRYNEENGTKLDPDSVVSAKDAAHMKFLPETKPIQAVLDIVKTNHGRVPMAIATGNSKNLTKPLLEMLDLAQYFDAVVYGDEVTHPKPHPECFLTAARLIGVSPEHCEVFEDGEPGIQGAIAAGMKVTDIRLF